MMIKPETAEESRWQSVLDEQPLEYRRLADSFFERHQLELLVGAYVLEWSMVDDFLGMVLATWANPAAGGRLQDIFGPQSSSQKIASLKLLLPEGWAHGERLLATMIEANRFRNTLAHGKMGMSGRYGERVVGWHVNQGKLGAKVTELDPILLREQTAKAKVLRAALNILMGPPYIEVEGSPPVDSSKSQSWNDFDLCHLIVCQPGAWETRTERDQFRELARKMFPKQKSAPATSPNDPANRDIPNRLRGG